MAGGYFSARGTPFVAPDPTGRRGRHLATVALVVASVLTLAVYLPQAVIALSVRAWPTTPGRIVGQTVTSELLYVSVGRSRNADVTERRLRVRYAYTVAGVPYVGTSIGRVHPYVHAFTSERKRLAEGTPVTVHYDPSDPADAVLDAGIPLDAVVLSLLGAAGLLWAARRARRREEPVE